MNCIEIWIKPDGDNNINIDSRTGVGCYATPKLYIYSDLALTVAVFLAMIDNHTELHTTLSSGSSVTSQR
jgi:hypothetical protein